jgi:hypothetical protein
MAEKTEPKQAEEDAKALAKVLRRKAKSARV